MDSIINECIIVRKKLGDTIILAKNRDRPYKPKLEVVHELINGVEVVHLHDIVTDWSEGMNQYGVGVVNTALLVYYDEQEYHLISKKGKKPKDGMILREALGQRTLKDTIKTAIKYMGGIAGHTFFSTPDKIISLETTPKHPFKLKQHPIENQIVRTNHGDETDAGYKGGPNLKSSRIRKASAEKIMNHIDDPKNILDALRKDFFEVDSNLNMNRKTKNMLTSSQVLLNLTDMIFEVHYFEDRVEEFKGIVNKLPLNYEPKIKIEIKKI
jgi:hypothetical protein